MTINVISDLHCTYDIQHRVVNFNRSTRNLYSDVFISESKQLNDYISRIQESFEKRYYKQFLDCCKDFKRIKKQDFHITDDYVVRDITTLTSATKYIKQLRHFLNNITEDKLIHFIDVCDSLDNYLYQVDPQKRFDFTDIKFVLYRLMSEFKLEKLQPADYLIIAGDLGLDHFYKDVYSYIKEKTKDKFKDVFFVKGNHDYWCKSYLPEDYTIRTDINLEDRYLYKEIDDCVILGCTLWSPIDEEHKYIALSGMNDYNMIPKFDTYKVNELYHEESNWLRENIAKNKGKKIIVVTHHLPRRELIDSKFSKSRLNCCYAVMDNGCNDIKPDIWIHGHSHNYLDTTIDGVRYIRNPIGYREAYGFYKSEVEPDYWYNTIIEV